MAHRRRAPSATPPDKTCVSCGRRIEWRAKWADDWADVRYCSAACRRRGVTDQDRQLEERILGMLPSRGSTVDPTHVAQAAAAGDEQAERALVEPVRRAARRLVDRGDVVIVQNGAVVDPSAARGAIAIRRS